MLCLFCVCVCEFCMNVCVCLCWFGMCNDECCFLFSVVNVFFYEFVLSQVCQMCINVCVCQCVMNAYKCLLSLLVCELCYEFVSLLCV